MLYTAVTNTMTYLQTLFTSWDTVNAQPSLAVKKGIPKNLKNLVALVNYAGMTYVILYIIILHYVTLHVTAPFYYNHLDSEAAGMVPISLRLFGWYMTFNALTNFVLMLFGAVKSVYCTPKDLPLYGDRTHPDWSKCSVCDVMVPPRTRHCNICNCCVIKRDHHCFFAGCCIGFHNQRYFICFCFSGIIASCVSFYYLIQYLSANYVTFLGMEFFKYFLPYALVILLIGKLSWDIMLLLLVFYFTLTTIVGCTYFLIWQINIAINGQTSYEFVKGKKLYQTTVAMHLQSIFGPYWILNLLFPMPFLKNYGNGISWEIYDTKYL